MKVKVEKVETKKTRRKFVGASEIVWTQEDFGWVAYAWGYTGIVSGVDYRVMHGVSQVFAGSRNTESQAMTNASFAMARAIDRGLM